MPLEVEPDVAGVRLGQEAEAALLLVVQELVEVRPRLATAELELGLVADLLEALRPEAVRGAVAGPAERAQLGERLDAVRHELLRPAAAHPGHEHEMVVGLELRAAHVPEVADPAVPAGPRVRLVLPLAATTRNRSRTRRWYAWSSATRKRLPLAAAVLDVHALDRRALQPLDHFGVEEELKHVRGLGRPRELRVDRLVGSLRRLLEEVREAVPAAVLALEVRLVDDVGCAVAHGLLREPPRHVGVEVLVVVGRDPNDRAALALEPLRGTPPRARGPSGR